MSGTEDNLHEMLSIEAGREHYRTLVRAEGHTITVDEPLSSGGTGLGMSPVSLLLASLGSCTAITLRMYADRKAWPLDGVRVLLGTVEQEDEATGIVREIELIGDLTDEQKVRLLQIAGKCRIHKILSGEIRILDRMG